MLPNRCTYTCAFKLRDRPSVKPANLTVFVLPYVLTNDRKNEFFAQPRFPRWYTKELCDVSEPRLFCSYLLYPTLPIGNDLFMG